MLFNDVVGHYRNRNQAFSNPSTWPQIDIRIIEPSYGILLAKSWYKYRGEDNPYNYIQCGARMVSKIRFNGKEYRAIDTGYDLETGEFRWGKEESEGEFIFQQI